jgi:hypothetical protein
MIGAYLRAREPATRTLELIRSAALLLSLIGWVMYPVELLLLEHWTDSWESRIPFIVAIPGFVLTAWVLFRDRDRRSVRTAFIVTMWLAIAVGALGAYFHLLWNFDESVSWEFAKTAAAAAGARPVLAALAFTHMGVTGLAAMYRVQRERRR